MIGYHGPKIHELHRDRKKVVEVYDSAGRETVPMKIQELMMVPQDRSFQTHKREVRPQESERRKIVILKDARFD